MNYSVTPLQKYSEISYRMKCVAVESERVFGDLYITEQTRNEVYQSLPQIYGTRKCNLIKQVLDGPNFLELNVKRPSRSYSLKFDEIRRPNRRTKSVGDEVDMIVFNYNNTIESCNGSVKRPKVYPAPLTSPPSRKEVVVTSLVDRLLLDIYGFPMGERGRSESDSTASSLKPRPQHQYLQKARLLLKSANELQVLVVTLREHINHTGALLVRQLRRKDYLIAKRDKQCDIITAHLQAHSSKRVEDTKMRFSLTPQPGESGFQQWLDAMKMVARLQGGIPPEFRKRLWLTLAERHLEQRGVDWKQAEKVCFNEWSNPDDEELGIQIVKDLHRTGCSLFCGAAGRDNQAVLRRVLLGFARWNKSVGYCQGLNVLAALVLQVMDRAESSAVKVMIYLIEGVLPEGYFADNLRGLSVDMAVFRDLLRSRLPKLSRHLEALQSDAKDKSTGSSYEPPLTNVFTMQWFLTLFCHCLPQEAVLRVWDLIFLEGDEVLLRTALAIWEGLSDRIMTVTSADEFYSIMGVLTREMLEFTDTNNLIKNIVSMGPLQGVTSLREKHRYNITPWARKLSDDDDSDTEEDERLAVAAAMFNMAQRLKKERMPSTVGALQAMAPSNDRERLALDISTLKQQYAKLRERQRQAHIILSDHLWHTAACARQSMVPAPTSQAMNHLLVGKSALVSGKNRPLSLPSGTTTTKTRPTVLHSPRTQSRRERQGVTLHWKDTKRPKQRQSDSSDTFPSATLQSSQETSGNATSPRRSNADSDSDSTSTELCDEPDRMSDVDSEEATSASDLYVMATDDEKVQRIDSPTVEAAPVLLTEDISKSAVAKDEEDPGVKDEELKDSPSETHISFAKIADQIRRLSAGDDNNLMIPQASAFGDDGKLDESLNKPLESIEADVSSDFVRSTAQTLSTLEKFDYFNVSEEVGDDEVKGRYGLRELEEPRAECKVIDDAAVTDRTEQNDRTLSTSVGTSEKNSDVYQSYSSIVNTNYDRATLDEKDTYFDRSCNYQSTGYTKTETNGNFSRTDKIKSLDTGDTEQSFYSKKYVTDHYSVSPLTAEQESGKTLLSLYETSGRSGSIIQESYTTSETTEKSFFKDRQHSVQKQICPELKKSPVTPESSKSLSSGETMGPDSKPSSLTMSPRTPLRSESRDFTADASMCSSVSSDSKTLVLHSIGSDLEKGDARLAFKKDSYERSSPSTPFSTDSLRNRSDTSPKLVVSSSSDSCSPSKLKSSERSFSSDLQSPVSANSIKYTSTYGKRGQDNVSSSSPIDLNSTSPFYPIAHPNQKTPSPYNASKRRSSIDSVETSPEQKLISSKDAGKYLGYKTKLDSSLKSSDVKDSDDVPRKCDLYVRPRFDLKKNDLQLDSSLTTEREKSDISYGISSSESLRRSSRYDDENADESLLEKDTVPQLPQEKLDKHFLSYSYRRRDRSRLSERSSSSLEKRSTDLKTSASTDEFKTTMAKKRSSDILEDMKHLEAKVYCDGTSDAGMMTKKSSDIWEDMKSLEARRQDTFSDSARGFSKRRLEIPDINIIGERRKSYVVQPKINIDESSDSILKTVSCNKDAGDSDDGRESKLGVWTKVKPRKKGANGRRSSDRALKIIQENSTILHNILACQAKKRLPDLEEISKEITISPINEEISKIFSPILEKMGLNEHEINEELARINFKDFDSMTATSVSEFDAKINDELSKLSLIDDTEETDRLDVDEIISHDYLDTREALIDRKINEELSKLLANYEEASPPSIANRERDSSSQNVSDIEGLDLSSISTNVFSYKSSNDSIETRSDLGSAQDVIPEKIPQYAEKVLPYAKTKYDQYLSPESGMDIYRELEKLDKISSAQVLPDVSVDIHQKPLSPVHYPSNSSPYSEMSSMRYSKPYDTSPLKSSYDPYKTLDYKPSISPRKTSSNSYGTCYEKPIIDSSFEYMDHKAGLPTNSYDLHIKSPMLTKESLEFRVRYDDEPRQASEYSLSQKDTRQPVDLNKGVSYYNAGSKPITSGKYLSKDERCLDTSAPFLDYSTEKSDILRRKYDPLSPKDYSRTTDYDRHLGTLPLEQETDLPYLPSRRREYHSLSPNRQFGDPQFASGTSYYSSTVSSGFGEEAKHLDFPGKVVQKYAELPERGASCYKKSSLSLGNLGHTTKGVEENYDTTPSPKNQFSPFPVRNAPRKPKELTLKLGLYSPKGSDIGQSKRS